MKPPLLQRHRCSCADPIHRLHDAAVKHCTQRSRAVHSGGDFKGELGFILLFTSSQTADPLFHNHGQPL